jgi:hypothetical protein
MPEFTLGHSFNDAEMAALIAPRLVRTASTRA